MAVARNVWKVPISIEASELGVRVMLAGTAKLVVLTGLLLLHPTRPLNAKMRKPIKNANPKRPHLPMHPPRPHGLPRGEQRLLGMYSLRKISSVEAANLFGKLNRLMQSAKFRAQ